MDAGMAGTHIKRYRYTRQGGIGVIMSWHKDRLKAQRVASPVVEKPKAKKKAAPKKATAKKASTK